MKRKKKNIKKNKALTAISMFSGCGGMDLGFHNAGFEIIWANDNNPDCASTYIDNFTRLTGKNVFQAGDIEDVDTPSFPRKTDLDVLIGGFPCQAYSNAGQRNGLLDKRGRLYEHCLAYIKAFTPRFTVFENVRGFLTIKGKTKKLYEEISDALIDLGYEVHLGLVNAADYGVPQNRLRVLMIGKRKDLPNSYFFPHRKKGIDLSLGPLLKVPKNTPNQDDIIKLNPQAYTIGALVPEGGSWKSIPYKSLPKRLQFIRDNMQRYRWPNFYRRFSRREIAGTITAAFKPENAGVWHPTKSRTFTAREIARIQSFPDDFIFTGRSVKAIYQMIGNAVPPLLSKSIAESIAASLVGKAAIQKVNFVDGTNKMTTPIRPGAPELIFTKKE
jgi:DNA (cytosine-5)-methyltransferase 1